MPNNENEINPNVWDEADLLIQNEIRILYHKLKKQEEDKQFITDCESYFRTGKNRPNIFTENQIQMEIHFN
jgi:hypothetical protein